MKSKNIYISTLLFSFFLISLGLNAQTTSTNAIPGQIYYENTLDTGEKTGLMWDTEGNEYHVATFNSEWWMVWNLRSKTGLVVSSYSYPQANGPVKPLEELSLWQKSHGLLYTWAVASGGKVAPGGEGNINHASVQGICPNGWHLPSDYEVNKLEEEIYNNASIYSSSLPSDFVPATWQNTWNTDIEYRGSTNGAAGHGHSMQSAHISAGRDDLQRTGGVSYSPHWGGFDIWLTGYVANGVQETFNKRGYLWTSSSNSTTDVWIRFVEDIDNPSLRAKVYRNVTSPNVLLPIRCKKD